MHRGFTKLFNTIVTSTIWQEDDKTRIVWITMLAIADAFGNVFAAIPGLASVANVGIEACEKAIANLKAPDSYSRTKDFEGRRVEEIEGGWHILNYDKYRKMMNEEERREYKARWIADKRRQKSTPRRLKSTKSTQAEAEAEADKEKKGRPPVSIPSETRLFKKFKEWMEYRRSIGRRPKDWSTFFAKQAQWLMTFSDPDQIEILDQSIRNGWMGLFEPKKLNGQKKPTTPDYKRNYMPPPYEPTEEELARQRKIVREASAKLREELKK